MTDQKSPPEVNPLAPAAPQGGHKNQAIGPATGNLVADWRRDRDYEQFMPTPKH